MHDTQFRIPGRLREFLRETIASTGGNEVYFLGRVSWGAEGEDRVAELEEVDVRARGNQDSVPAVLEGCEKWDIAIHNHPGGCLDPSDADISLAAELAARSVGFAIISNDASRHYLVTVPFPRREIEPLDLEEVRAVFAPDGPLARECRDYETRTGQIEMALEVTRALNEDTVVAAEAGTGVGKGFAYLVPAILWAVKNSERVIVSTGTINLQEQLVGKDLPLLASVLPVQFRYALVKGRNNYACLRKVQDLAQDLEQPDLFPAEGDRPMLSDLVEWASSTSDGSKSDLSWVPPPAVWEEVMSETDKSLKVNCPHYKDCFYYRAKRNATSSQIIVVNHHLFFADLSVRRSTNNYQYDAVLPAYRRVVFDEAHHLEDVASEYFGFRLTRGGLFRRLGRLRSSRTRHRGTIPTLIHRLRGLGDRVAADSIQRTFDGSLPEVMSRVEGHLDVIEDAVAAVAATVGVQATDAEPAVVEPAGTGGDGPSISGRKDERPFQLRYREGGGPPWDLVAEKLSDVAKELSILVKVTGRAIETLEASPLGEAKVAGLLLELTSTQSRFTEIVEQIERFCLLGEGDVRWIGWRGAGPSQRPPILEFGLAPIRVAEDLKASVFDPMSTVVLTSATLSVAGDMTFLAERLGLSLLDRSRFRFRKYSSPFEYQRQVLLLVPTDLPAPESSNYARHVPEAVYRIVQASGGRAFVLFTSYSLLRSAYAALEDRLQDLGLRPAAQGDADRSELLRRFRSGAVNVLFATDSFWEGVDVKGRALECVIMARLPFRVPSEPIQEARLEDLQKHGANPFTEFTVPQAVLKFKQGFGRLIRAKTDQGIVVVLDRRILTKPYGRVFLESLPETGFFQGPLSRVVERVKSFLGEAPRGPDHGDQDGSTGG